MSDELIPDVRLQIVKWALYLVTNRRRCIYTETPERSNFLDQPIGHLPFEGDCSSTDTACYFWAGAPDPNDLDYAYAGDTDTLIAHGQHIARDQAMVADIIIFGLNPTRHAALIVREPNSLCMSMGHQGDPSLISADNLAAGVHAFWGGDSNVMTFCRFDTRNRHLPPEPGPGPRPA